MNEIQLHNQSFETMLATAEKVLKSGFLPTSIKTPEQALTIMLTGQELGIKPMHALRCINVIQGKPVLSSELQLSLFLKNGGDVKWIESTAEKAVIELKRQGSDHWHRETFTIQDAQRAGLTGKDIWKKYPKALLKARVTSSGLRAVAPDVQMGVYDPEELESIEVPEIVTGEVVDDDPPPTVDSPGVDPPPAEPKTYNLSGDDHAKFTKQKEALGEERYKEIMLKLGYEKRIHVPKDKRDYVLNELNYEKRFIAAKNLVGEEIYKSTLISMGYEKQEHIPNDQRDILLTELRMIYSERFCILEETAIKLEETVQGMIDNDMVKAPDVSKWLKEHCNGFGTINWLRKDKLELFRDFLNI